MNAIQRAQLLPPSLAPVGLNREQAAALIGISPSLYEKGERAGVLPAPHVIFGRLVYDREEVIAAFRATPKKAGVNDTGDGLDGPDHQGNPWNDD